MHSIRFRDGPNHSLMEFQSFYFKLLRCTKSLHLSSFTKDLCDFSVVRSAAFLMFIAKLCIAVVYSHHKASRIHPSRNHFLTLVINFNSFNSNEERKKLRAMNKCVLSISNGIRDINVFHFFFCAKMFTVISFAHFSDKEFTQNGSNFILHFVIARQQFQMVGAERWGALLRRCPTNRRSWTSKFKNILKSSAMDLIEFSEWNKFYDLFKLHIWLWIVCDWTIDYS